MASLDTVTARRLARSILEARKEGRALRPLTNTHLLSRLDALRIQDALLDLRIAQGEVLVGWYLERTGELAPLTDRMYFPAQPVGLVDAQQIEAVAINEDSVTRAVLIIDRVIKGGLQEDFLAHGCGLVGVIIGDPITSDSGLDGVSAREEVATALKLRKRDLRTTDLVIRAVR